MAIVREPRPLPSDLNYVPAEGAPYRVATGDSWYSLAERPEVRATGMTANDLCYFNFKTRNPPEINWYLHHKIGCRRTTQDGKNFMFSAADQPGIVYLPRVGAPQPVNAYPPVQKSDRTNAWFGVGVKTGTQFFVVGIETLAGYVASLDDLGKGMAIASSINRVGPGVGASVGGCFIYITGVSTPSQLNGHQQGDWDFNVALGGNWGKAAQAAGKAKKLQPLIDVLIRIGTKTPSGLKTALRADPDKWVELIKAGKTVKEYVGIDPNSAPNVFVFDIPFAGVGLEASGFYALSNFDAVWDFTD